MIALLRCVVLRCVALRCVVLRCVALCCVALRCVHARRYCALFVCLFERLRALLCFMFDAYMEQNKWMVM
jgi:hypothetical protein